jgi:alpha-tubulin suppressor-like RCC1 family protein
VEPTMSSSLVSNNHHNFSSNSANGKLMTFGWNNEGQCGRVNINNSTLLSPDFVPFSNEIIQCSAGDAHSLILTSITSFQPFCDK